MAGIDPHLLPLADHGGPTWTMALAPDSPAIDAGSDVFAPGSDQRGQPRPVGRASDIGAFEFQPDAVVPSATATLQPDGSVRLRFVAWPNRTVVLESTTDWRDWRGVVTNVTDARGVFPATDVDQDGAGHAFFRLRAGP